MYVATQLTFYLFHCLFCRVTQLATCYLTVTSTRLRYSTTMNASVICGTMDSDNRKLRDDADNDDHCYDFCILHHTFPHSCFSLLLKLCYLGTSFYVLQLLFIAYSCTVCLGTAKGVQGSGKKTWGWIFFGANFTGLINLHNQAHVYILEGPCFAGKHLVLWLRHRMSHSWSFLKVFAVEYISEYDKNKKYML